MKKVIYLILILLAFLFIPNAYAAGNVKIENVVLESNSSTAEELNKPIFDGLSIKFDIKFTDKDDYVKYKVVIDNPTSEDYEITESNNFSESDYISYTYTYEDDSKIAKKNSKTVMYITINYKENVPSSLLTNGSYTETNNLVINLGNGIIDVPDTFIYSGFLLIVLLSLGISLLIIKETKNKKYLSLLIIGIAMIPISMYAIEKLQIKVDTKVTIDKINMIESRYTSYDESGNPEGNERDFWQYSDYIETITFKNKIEEPSTYAYKFDVSNDKDETVWAYLVEIEDGTPYYNLYIMANGNIYANPDSNYVFAYMLKLNDIKGLEYYKTVTATSMKSMFELVNSMEIIDLTTFNTSNVTNMESMFSIYAGSGYSSTGFREIILDNWDTSKVKDMSSMFAYQFYLENIGLSNWDTSNVTDMSYMFYAVGQETTTFNLDLSNWDTSNVTDMSGMFNSAGDYSAMFNLDLSNWNTSKVNDMSGMFTRAGKNATEWNIIIPKTNGNGINNTTDKMYGSLESKYATPNTGRLFTLAE